MQDNSQKQLNFYVDLLRAAAIFVMLSPFLGAKWIIAIAVIILIIAAFATASFLKNKVSALLAPSAAKPQAPPAAATATKFQSSDVRLSKAARKAKYKKLRANTDLYTSASYVPAPATGINDAIAKKLKTNNKYEMLYTNARGETSSRFINFQSATRNNSNNLIIYAYCHTRKAVRAFRADNIESLVDVATGEQLI